jgi:hypothetical protein
MGPFMWKSVLEFLITLTMPFRDIFMRSDDLRSHTIIPADNEDLSFFSLRRVRAEIRPRL